MFLLSVKPTHPNTLLKSLQKTSKKLSEQAQKSIFFNDLAISSSLKICIMLGVIFLAFPTTLRAENTLPKAGQDLAGQAERFRQEYSLERKLIKLKRSKALIENAPSTESSVAGNESFVLKDIHITGMTIIEPERLRSIWVTYLGEKITMKDLQHIIDEIKDLYSSVKFLTSKVYLPVQEISSGFVEIRVAEGRMGALNVEGNKHVKTAMIKKAFHTPRGQILDLNNIQKDVMRLNENPDLNVRTILEPGETPETTNVTLKVKDKNPVHVYVGFDNQGTRLVGRYRESISVSTTNLTGHLDQLSLSAVKSTLSSGEFLSYRLPVGSNGVKVGMDLGNFNLKLGKELKPSRVTGSTKTYTPNMSWEMYRSENVQINSRIGLRIKDIKKQVDRTKVTDDQLRLPYYGIDIVRSDATGQTNFSPELSFGTDRFLGATSRNNINASRAGAGGAFTKYEHNLSRTQRMPWDSYLQVKSGFQAASESLPSSEQFQLGGANSIRGYPEGDYLADMGANLNTDWVFPMYVIPESWRLKGSEIDLRHQIQPVIFMDLGGGKLDKVLPGEVKSKFLMGVGGGLRFNFNSFAYLKLEWGYPLGDDPIRGTGPSTFNVSVQIGK